MRKGTECNLICFTKDGEKITGQDGIVLSYTAPDENLEHQTQMNQMQPGHH